MTDEFKCQHCAAPLPAYLPDDRCPECRIELDKDVVDVLNRTGGNMDQTVGPTTASASVGASDTSIEKEYGDYLLVNEIARGGMGVVYRARQKSLDRMVALKMILDGQFASQLEIDRFHIEAQAAAHLDHPGIVPIYEIGEHDGRHFFSMALIEGQSLAEKIAEGPIGEIQAAQILKKIAEAMDYAHQRGVIHRDLKPDNILIDSSGQPRVTDFGLAKQPGKQRNLTVSGQTLGTPSYMSPEQASGRGDVTEATDVYALGAILYAMLSGRPPFQGGTLVDTLTQVIEREPRPLRIDNSSIHADIELICLKCLEKDPAERYESAEQLIRELERFLNGEPIDAVPLSPIGKFQRWRRIIARNRDVRLRSATSVMGFPIVDIAYGRDNDAGETHGHAMGVIAFGDTATGLFAFGKYSRGLIFAYGVYAVGMFSFGLFALGLIGCGLISCGFWATGGLAIGWYSFGAIAIGCHAVGFIAAGVHSLGAFRWQWVQTAMEWRSSLIAPRS